MKGRWEASYNERLFSGGLRGFLHTARFRWLANQVTALNCQAERVLELGCYDGKTIDYLPKKPRLYVGFDADMEDGLALAAKKWGDHSQYRFYRATRPADMTLANDEIFDMAVAMETLEHIPTELVDPYLAKIARHLRGYFFVTVPNEIGIVFFAKWLGKRLLTHDDNPYSSADVLNHTIGRLHRVERDHHKGFDYARVVEQIAQHFRVLKVSAVPFRALPPYLSFSAGIVACSR